WESTDDLPGGRGRAVRRRMRHRQRLLRVVLPDLRERLRQADGKIAGRTGQTGRKQEPPAPYPSWGRTPEVKPVGQAATGEAANSAKVMTRRARPAGTNWGQYQSRPLAFRTQRRGTSTSRM